MKKLTIFIAAVLVFSMVAIAASAATLKNVAEGKTYTVEIISGGDETPYGYNADNEEGFGDGPNGIRQRLTDGVAGEGEGGGGGEVGAQKATEAVFVIDLGKEVSNIKKLTMDLYKNDGWGIAIPVSVEYAISNDNTTFTSLGVVEVSDSNKVADVAWDTWYMDLNLTEAKSARYVKITAKASNYVWSTEIQVLAEDAGSSTPDTSDNTVYVALALVISVSSAALVLKKKDALNQILI